MEYWIVENDTKIKQNELLKPKEQVFLRILLFKLIEKKSAIDQI